VISCVRKAHEECDPLGAGPWRPEPALDLEQAVRRPWLLLPYVLHWHWAWNAVCWVVQPMRMTSIKPATACLVQHADAALLVACYAYMMRTVWMWRKPPPPPPIATPAKKKN
jgi:hypothetical protein